MTLTPIAWGTRDRALGRAVCSHIRYAMPPMVILWAPGDRKFREAVKDAGGIDAKIEQLYRLMENTRSMPNEKSTAADTHLSIVGNGRERLRLAGLIRAKRNG